MNVAALLHDSPSDDHRKRQENKEKEKEREKGQSSYASPPLQPSQQQQPPPPGVGDGGFRRSYSPLGGPGQQGQGQQRQAVSSSPTNTYDARLREREMRERGVAAVVVGRERERAERDFDHPPYHRPYSHSLSHHPPPPMATNLPLPPMPVGSSHQQQHVAPRTHQTYSHSPPAMHPNTGTPPFVSPLSTPRDAAPPGSAPLVPSAALAAPAPEHSAAEYGASGTQREDRESAHRRRAVRSLSSATAPSSLYLSHNNPRDRDRPPPLAMRPRSPDAQAAYRTPGEQQRTTTTRSPVVQPGPGFSVVPPSAQAQQSQSQMQSPHQARATPPMGAMAPPPPSSSSNTVRRGQHTPGGHAHGVGVPGASTLSSPAMDSLRPHDNEQRRSGPPTPIAVATVMSASAAGALQPLAMRGDQREQRFERYPVEDPHQQQPPPPPHHGHPHSVQQQQQQQQRRVSRSSSMSGGVGPGAGGLGPHPYVMSPELGGGGGGRSRDDSLERDRLLARAEREREREKWEIERAKERGMGMGMGGGPHHHQQQQQRLHHVQHPHHNHHPEHLRNLQHRERGLPPETTEKPLLTTAPAPTVARAGSSRQGRREKDAREGSGRGREAGGAGGPPPDTGGSRGGGGIGSGGGSSGGILTLAPPGVTVSKEPPPQAPPAGSQSNTPGMAVLPAPAPPHPGSRSRSPNPASFQTHHGQQQQYSSPTLHLGPVGGPGPDGPSSPEVAPPHAYANAESHPFPNPKSWNANRDREQQKSAPAPPLPSSPSEPAPYGYVDSETYPYTKPWHNARERRPPQGEGAYAGGEVDGPSSSGIPPRVGTPGRLLAGPGAGGAHPDAYHPAQAQFHHREHERERDPHADPHLLAREQYHPHRRPPGPPSPPPFSSRSAGGRHHPPPPPGQDGGPLRRLERAPPPPHQLHANYPPPPSTAPLPHPHSHQQPGFPPTSHVHPRHYPPSTAPPGGLYPPPPAGHHNAHLPMGHGMDPAPLTIQLLPPHPTLPIAPLSPPGDFNSASSPLDPPLHIGTFVYPRLPFPYTFPTVLSTSSPNNAHGSEMQEDRKIRKREFGDEMMDEGNISTQSATRAGRTSRRERETHVTILIPNASLPSPPPSPTSPISPSSSSSSAPIPMQTIRKPPPPCIWGGGLPTDFYSHQYFSRIYGAQQSVALSSSSSRGQTAASANANRREQQQQEPQLLRRIYTDDSDVRLCALHAGCISYAGLRRARRRGMDLRVKLALGRDMGRYVGGLPSEAVVLGTGAGGAGEPVDVGLTVGEEDGVEEGEVEEVMEERERVALMEGLRSADWMSGHDGCAFEVLGAEWVPKGTAQSLGLRNRTQRLKEYGEQRAAMLQDQSSGIGKRKQRMEAMAPYPAVVTLSDTELLLSRERTIIFGGWDRRGSGSIGYKYDSETFKGVLFGSQSVETTSRSTSVLNPVNAERQTTKASTSSKRRKVNGTAPTRVERQGDNMDEDVEMNDAKVTEDVNSSTVMKSIVLENDREKFLLEVLQQSSGSETNKEKGKEEADKENLPAAAIEDDAAVEKDTALTRTFKLSILGVGSVTNTETQIETEGRILGTNLRAEDVRCVEGGLAVSLGLDKDADSRAEGIIEDEENKKSEGLFIRVERWRWATRKELEVV